MRWSHFVVFLHFILLMQGLQATLSDNHTPKMPTVWRINSTDNANGANYYTPVSRNESKTLSMACQVQDSCQKPVDCEELLRMGCRKNGVYTIWPRNKILEDKSLEVYCDLETDNGGWTVLQRRGNFLRPKDYFYKDWASYKVGFGDIEKDFWLGNDNIFALTNQRLYSVRFDLADVEGEHRYALYDKFFIENEENKYRLTILDYSGTADDSMTEKHNGQKFSTKDQDNDGNMQGSSAKSYKGGWWYGDGHWANLNGLYLRGRHESFADGIEWNYWKGLHESLESTTIKIRPTNFRQSFVQHSDKLPESFHFLLDTHSMGLGLQ